MNAARIIYRTRQVLLNCGAYLTPGDWDAIEALLNSPQLELFKRMQKGEQTHSLRVLKELLQRGENQPDLLIAALLHDVGKSRFQLSLWERVVVVLGKALAPSLTRRWGCELPVDLIFSQNELQVPGWRRPFVIAYQHPVWGAELVAKTGASPLTVALIKNHQESVDVSTQASSSVEARLLLSLRTVDDES